MIPGGGPAAVAISRDGRTVAAGRKKVYLWRAHDGRLLRTIGGPEHVHQLSFSSDASLLSVSQARGGTDLFRVADGKRQYSLQAMEVEFSPRQPLLASNRSTDVTLQFLRLPDLRILHHLGPSGQGIPMKFSPDGKLFAFSAVIHGPAIKLIRVRDGKPARVIPVNSLVRSLAFSPDGNLLASGHWQKDRNGRKIRLWRVPGGKPLPTLLGNTRYPVHALDFSPSGEILISGSTSFVSGRWSGEIHFWQVRDGSLLQSFPVGGGVYSLHFARGGRSIVYGTMGGEVIMARNPFFRP